MSELHYRTALDVAAAINREELSSRQVTQHLLKRIGTMNPKVNAVVELAEDDVLAAADRADAHPLQRPLHGVPMTVKDAIDVVGLHTTWGNPEWKDAVAESDGTVVARLRAVGALIAGKTNVATMLADFGQTANPLFGTTKNPWNPDQAVGGSSGGSAAAVAAGMSYLSTAQTSSARYASPPLCVASTA